LFCVSLVLCGVRLWTHSLAASTLIHATYNGTIFTILFFATGGFRHLDKIN
jgi:membrane protease YdiL (CAAX protease family)